MLTYTELAALPLGTRLVFAEDYDIYPHARVRAGTRGEVTDNTLADDSQPGCIALLPDDLALRETLREWDGCIILIPRKDGTPMQAASPLEREKGSAHG